MKFEDKYFRDFIFTKDQIKKNFDNAIKDLKIAKQDAILEVKFTYAYSALIKGGIALASFYNKKLKSMPGHHVKIIEMIALALKDGTVEVVGNAMRSKRNTDFYSGGIEVTKKESEEYLEFADDTLRRIKEVIK